jgi:AbrB family looped-hinge helix DNA binding protein
MTISRKGQITIPAALRDRDHISAGDVFNIKKLRKGKYLIRRVKEAPNKGLVDWLLSCPVKGVLQTISSESTDTL